MDSQDTLYGLPLELWNIEHIGRHGVDLGEAEEVVRRSRPCIVGDGRYLSKVAAMVAAAASDLRAGRRWHRFRDPCRPMSEREKRHFRRRWR